MDDERWSFNLYNDVKKLWVGGVPLILASALVLFRVLRLRLEMDQDPSLTISKLKYLSTVITYIYVTPHFGNFRNSSLP